MGQSLIVGCVGEDRGVKQHTHTGILTLVPATVPATHRHTHMHVLVPPTNDESVGSVAGLSVAPLEALLTAIVAIYRIRSQREVCQCVLYNVVCVFFCLCAILLWQHTFCRCLCLVMFYT